MSFAGAVYSLVKNCGAISMNSNGFVTIPEAAYGHDYWILSLKGY